MGEASVDATCAFCETRATQKCGGCKSVYYCSREHQKKHWKLHSKVCKAFKLTKDKTLGRHYVATRKIDVGEIVIKDENPLIAGPMHSTVPVCLNCYVVLTAKTAVPCEKCGWPLCLECKSHGPECEFTMKNKGTKVSITDFGLPHPTYRCICAVRALCLKNEHPEMYRKLLQLEDHCDLATRDMDYAFEKPLELARFIKRFFKVEDIRDEEIARIAGILQVNGHEVPITEPPYMAVYDLSSYLEHNCRANCSKTFTSTGGVIVRAVLPIQKGDHISICYTDPLWGLTSRRHHLLQTKFFECSCERCKDPTEFGMMYNAILCTKGECGGSMLPPTFIYQGNQPPDFVCDKCKNTSPWDQVEQMIEKIGQELAAMKKDNVDACKKFINRYRKLLHENHFYLTDVKVALAQIIGQQSTGLPTVNDDLLGEKIILCQKLNDILKTLVPAENRIRGLILFEMHAALAEFGRRQGKEELRGILMESRKFLAEAYELLRYEPEILPEGQVAIHAKNNLQQIDVLIKALCQNAVTPM
ncbi:SET domain-containing protein SmydA-8-like [Prorops nasuta]|uniref:SET domain-containing protein SmydA-8-like n=1 Tax=Prorops nasuta TaxID=863751 RepID=UPI0034CEEE53